jgi:hypothetical protein
MTDSLDGAIECLNFLRANGLATKKYGNPEKLGMKMSVMGKLSLILFSTEAFSIAKTTC